MASVAARAKASMIVVLTFRFSILGLVAAGQGAAAVNTKHQFLISSQLANQFNSEFVLSWSNILDARRGRSPGKAASREDDPITLDAWEPHLRRRARFVRVHSGAWLRRREVLS